MPKPIGAVHPGVPVIHIGCDRLQATIFDESTTAEDADRLHAQIEGVIERLQVLAALALARAQALTGRV